MAVDAARQDQHAARVDFARRARQRFPKGDDPAVLDADVARPDIGRGDEGPPANC